MTDISAKIWCSFVEWRSRDRLKTLSIACYDIFLFSSLVILEFVCERGRIISEWNLANAKALSMGPGSFWLIIRVPHKMVAWEHRCVFIALLIFDLLQPVVMVALLVVGELLWHKLRLIDSHFLSEWLRLRLILNLLLAVRGFLVRIVSLSCTCTGYSLSNSAIAGSCC